METVLRVAFFYVVIFLGLRVLGKREFGQLSPFELVMLMMIPELAAQALVREDFSATNALVALCTLFALVFLTSVVVHRSAKAEKVIEAKPSVLVYEGRFVTEHLNRERVTPGEIYAEMHLAGLERLEQVRWALLETDGKISLVPFDRDDEQIRRRSNVVT